MATASKEVDNIKKDVDALRSDIAKLVDSLGQAGKSKVDSGVNTAKGYADQAIAQAQDVRGQTEEKIRQNPLVAVGAAFGVGYVLGKLLDK